MQTRHTARPTLERNDLLVGVHDRRVGRDWERSIAAYISCSASTTRPGFHLLGRRSTLFASARSTITTWFWSPTFSRLVALGCQRRCSPLLSLVRAEGTYMQT